MDHFEMKRAMVRATSDRIDLVDNLKMIVLKPSHYSLAEITTEIQRAIVLLEAQMVHER